MTMLVGLANEGVRRLVSCGIHVATFVSAPTAARPLPTGRAVSGRAGARMKCRFTADPVQEGLR